ncbi:MAG: SprT family zinc-dependent metalloprotease [Xanthomonadales bacterium]
MKKYKIKPLQYNDQLIEYQVHHRPAVTRRIHLELNDDGRLRIIAPRRMSRRAIHKNLQQRVSRVARFLADARPKLRERPVHRYVNGEEHLFLGQNHPLEVVEEPGKRGSVELINGQIRVITRHARAETISNQLTRWYRQKAMQHFSSRLELISTAAPWTEGHAPPLRLRKMKRTWGSCSAAGVITLNPHLVKAPPECIDYVIAHELCHLQEHNHGKAFYALQEQLFPGWREAKAHLKTQSHIYLA